MATPVTRSPGINTLARLAVKTLIPRMTILEKVETWCFPECHFINHFIVQDVRKVTIPPAWALVFWTRLKLTRITSGRSHLTPPWPETPTEQPVTRATLRRPVTGSRHSISKARRRSARKICKRPSNTVWKVRFKAGSELPIFSLLLFQPVSLATWVVVSTSALCTPREKALTRILWLLRLELRFHS